MQPLDPAVDQEDHLDAQAEMRREAIEAGATWELGFPPLAARTVLEAATNAYSAAWEGSRHQVRDHLAALRAALAAAAPLLEKIKPRPGNPVAEARELITDILADTILPWAFYNDLPEQVTIDVVMSSGTARITITDPTPVTSEVEQS